MKITVVGWLTIAGRLRTSYCCSALWVTRSPRSTEMKTSLNCQNALMDADLADFVGP